MIDSGLAYKSMMVNNSTSERKLTPNRFLLNLARQDFKSRTRRTAEPAPRGAGSFPGVHSSRLVNLHKRFDAKKDLAKALRSWTSRSHGFADAPRGREERYSFHRNLWLEQTGFFFLTPFASTILSASGRHGTKSSADCDHRDDGSDRPGFILSGSTMLPV